MGECGGVKVLFAAVPSAVEGVPVVSNRFRIGIFTRCDSTKSTPSAVSVKSELSARVMYPLFSNIPGREFQIIAGKPHPAFNFQK